MSIYKNSKYTCIKEYTYTRNTQENTLYTDIQKDILMILKMSVLISLNYSRMGMNRKGGDRLTYHRCTTYIMEYLFDSNENTYRNHEDTGLSAWNLDIKSPAGLWVPHICVIDKRIDKRINQKDLQSIRTLMVSQPIFLYLRSTPIVGIKYRQLSEK